MQKRKAIVTLTVIALVALVALQFYNFRPEFPRGITVSFRGFTNDIYGKPVGEFVISNASSSGIFISDHGYGNEDQKHAATTMSPPIDPIYLSKWWVAAGDNYVIRYYAPPGDVPWTFAVKVARYGGREKLAELTTKCHLGRWVPSTYRSLKLVRVQSDTIPPSQARP